jgi:hypothetical protein
MTRVKLMSLVLAAVAVAASAQKPAVLLSNAENADLYYTIDPAPLVGTDTSSAVFVGKVVSFFSETAPEVPFGRLESLGVKRVEGLAEGTHLFVGFFALKGAAELPVRVVRLQAGGGIEERLYTVYREPATVMIKAGHGRLATLLPPESAAAAGVAVAAVKAADAAAEAPTEFWSRIEPMATFTGAFEPEIVVLQTSAGSRVIPFGAAKSWGVDGVRLREVRFVRRPEEVAFRVLTFGTMSEHESMLLYFQEDRAGGKDNNATIELAPEGDGRGGYALLWRKGAAKPAIVGRFAQQGSTIIGRIRFSDLASYLDLRSASPAISVDLCTGHHDAAKRTYEEFYHATIRLDQIPAVKDEGPLFL